MAYILLILILLWLLSSSQRYKSPWRSWARYVETKDGSWSLSLAQMAAWTLAVGCVVLHFGLIRLRVPDIPWTLIILMGSSAFTSLYGHYQVRRGAIVYPRQRLHGWKDLVMVVTESGRPMVSMAKGQMIFWTIIAISLFLYKSFWEGVLWDVSVELVGLMGISQAAFLAQEEVELRPREKAMSEAKDRERLQKSKVNP